MKVHIARFYEATRKAVDKWGGSASLASFWGCSESNVSVRLNRREQNGTLNYAFLDFAAIATAAPGAAEVFLFELCDLFGFERPKRKRTKTVDEKFRALVRELQRAGPLGEAAIRAAAAREGIDPAEYDL